MQSFAFWLFLIRLTQNGCVSSCNFCITGFNGENVSTLLTNLIIYPFTIKCRKITPSPTIMMKLKLCGMGKLVNSCVKIFTIIFYQPALFHFLVQPGFSRALVRRHPYTCSGLEHLALAWWGGCFRMGVRWSRVAFDGFRRSGAFSVIQKLVIALIPWIYLFPYTIFGDVLNLN